MTYLPESYNRLTGQCQILYLHATGGSSSVGRAVAFQATCRGFETRLPLFLIYHYL